MKVPILMYHEISDNDRRWCVKPEEFRKQMEWLAGQGYKTISLSEIKNADEKSVAITFDDNRKGVYDNAFPVMKKLGMKGVVFVVSDWIEGKNIPEREKYSEFMNKKQIKELADNGWEVGCHTKTHRRLTKVPKDELDDEITGAKKTLEEWFGSVKNFSYPYGEFNEEIENKVDAVFDSAAMIERGFADNPKKLRRKWVMRSTGLEDFGKIMTKTTLSLCMIAKNEEKLIARCLGSVKNFVDEIIMVDTGSTDRTIEIAKQFGAKIVEHEWKDDFSEARNVSLEHANGDWILVIDSDEIIAKHDLEKIRKLIEDENAYAYKLTQRNYKEKGSNEPGFVLCSEDKYEESDGYEGYFASSLVRLFRNKKQYRFENKVHELVEDSIKKDDRKVADSKVQIHHFKEMEKEKDKTELYIKIGRKQIEKTPTNPKPYYEVGKIYLEENKPVLAAKFLEQCVELLGDEKVLLSNFVFFDLGRCFFTLGEYDKAKHNLEKAIEHGASSAYLYLALIYHEEGKIDKAVEFYEKAVSNNIMDPVAYANLGNIYLKSEPKKAFDLLCRAVELNHPKKFKILTIITKLKGKLK